MRPILASPGPFPGPCAHLNAFGLQTLRKVGLVVIGGRESAPIRVISPRC